MIASFTRRGPHADDPSRRSSSGLTIVAFVVLSLFFLLTMLPLQSAERPDNVDDSWMAALHDSFAHHRQVGRDIVFTFGPMGYMFDGYDPDTNAANVAASSILAGLYFVVIAGISQPDGSSRVALAICGSFLLVFVVATPDLRVFFGPISVAISMRMTAAHRFGRLVRTSAGLAAGIASLIKFSCFVAATPIVLLALIDDLFIRRRKPLAAIGFLASSVLFWIASGQRLNGLDWITSSIEIVRGYSVAMTTTFRPGFLLLSGLAAVAAAILVSVAFPGRDARKDAILAFAAHALLIAAAVKASYVRYDSFHGATAPVTLLFLALGGLSLMRDGAGRWRTILAWITLVASVAIAWKPITESLHRPLATAIVSAPLDRLRLLESELSGDRRRAYENRLTEIAGNVPVEPDMESVDLYSTSQNALFAHEIDYSPRPVFQSYSAYTRKLLEINAEHLRSPSAARSLLIQPSTIDGRYPSFDDSLSFPILMSNYEVTTRRAEWLRLDRRETPRELSFDPVGTLRGVIGEVLPLPANDGVLWAEISISAPMSARILSTAFRPPVLYLLVEKGNGRIGRYRFVPAIAEAGFVLSPAIVSIEVMESMLSGVTEPDSRVLSLMIQPENKSDVGRHWNAEYEVRLQSIRIAGDAIPRGGSSLPNEER